MQIIKNVDEQCIDDVKDRLEHALKQDYESIIIFGYKTGSGIQVIQSRVRDYQLLVGALAEALHDTLHLGGNR